MSFYVLKKVFSLKLASALKKLLQWKYASEYVGGQKNTHLKISRKMILQDQ